MWVLRHSGILSQRLWKSGEEVSSEGSGPDGMQLPTDTTDRSQNVWQWIMESGRQPRHKSNGYGLMLNTVCVCHPIHVE